MVKVSMNLPEDIYEFLRKKSFTERKSMTSIVVDALSGNSIEEINLDEIPDEASEKTVSEVPVAQEPSQPELPPFCDANKNCRSRSTGHFKIITNDGTEEKILYLCPTHLGLAKREGEVKEL